MTREKLDFFFQSTFLSAKWRERKKEREREFFRILYLANKFIQITKVIKVIFEGT